MISAAVTRSFMSFTMFSRSSISAPLLTHPPQVEAFDHLPESDRLHHLIQRLPASVIFVSSEGPGPAREQSLQVCTSDRMNSFSTYQHLSSVFQERAQGEQEVRLQECPVHWFEGRKKISMTLSSSSEIVWSEGIRQSESKVSRCAVSNC